MFVFYNFFTRNLGLGPEKQSVEPHIVHSSVKGGRKALDNGMMTAAPRIHMENHHANLVIK